MPDQIPGIASRIVGKIGDAAVGAAKGGARSVVSAANPLNILRLGGGPIGGVIANSIETVFGNVTDAIKETKEEKREAEKASNEQKQTNNELEKVREQLKEQQNQDRELLGKGNNGGILSEILESVNFSNEILSDLLNTQNEIDETQREQLFQGIETERESKRKIQDGTIKEIPQKEKEEGIFDNILGKIFKGVILGGLIAAVSGILLTIGPEKIKKWITDLSNIKMEDIVDKFKDFASNATQTIEKLTNTLSLLKDFVTKIFHGIEGAFMLFRDSFNNTKDGIKTIRNKLFDSILELEDFKSFDQKIKENQIPESTLNQDIKTKEQSIFNEKIKILNKHVSEKIITQEDFKIKKDLAEKKLIKSQGKPRLIFNEKIKNIKKQLERGDIDTKGFTAKRALAESTLKRDLKNPGLIKAPRNATGDANERQIQTNISKSAKGNNIVSPKTTFGGNDTKETNESGSGETIMRQALDKAGISDPTERAAFLAQMSHESGGFTKLVEIGSGQQYEGRRNLGNTEPGDGPKYKGRGFIQLTGRANYRTFGQTIGVDLENNPELAANPEIAAKVAIAFWNQRVKSNVSDFNNTEGITKIINGGFNGLSDRKRRFAQFKAKSPNIQQLAKNNDKGSARGSTSFLSPKSRENIFNNIEKSIANTPNDFQNTNSTSKIANLDSENAIKGKLALLDKIETNLGLKSKKDVKAANVAGGNMISNNTQSNVNTSRTTINQQGLRHQDNTIQRLTGSQFVG